MTWCWWTLVSSTKAPFVCTVTDSRWPAFDTTSLFSRTSRFVIHDACSSYYYIFCGYIRTQQPVPNSFLRKASIRQNDYMLQVIRFDIWYKLIGSFSGGKNVMYSGVRWLRLLLLHKFHNAWVKKKSNKRFWALIQRKRFRTVTPWYVLGTWRSGWRLIRIEFDLSLIYGSDRNIPSRMVSEEGTYKFRFPGHYWLAHLQRGDATSNDIWPCQLTSYYPRLRDTINKRQGSALAEDILLRFFGRHQKGKLRVTFPGLQQPSLKTTVMQRF
jgi:hypothetical protein